MKKHLCGLAIILLICAALFALPAFAADVAKNESTGTLYDTLDAALEESNDGDTITLLDDVETADPEGEGSYTYWPLTIEMNGHGITGKLTVTDDLKLKGGWFYGLLVVDISGEEGALTITAPDTADYAVNQMLTVNDGTVNISGAKIAVRGTLSVSSGTAVTLSGTEKAVELFGAETFGNKFYGAVDAGGNTDTAAVYNAEQQTYTVGGVAAKKLSNINAGEPDPAEKPTPSPSKNTLDARAGAPTDFKVNFTGTENLEVSIQKSALDDTIRVSAGKTADNMWTVTVTLADEPKQSGYLLHIYPEGDPTRSATVTVKVCTAHDYGWSMDTNGVESVACKNCGKRCTHQAPGADGKCTECGFTLEAQVGDTYYAYFSSAVKAAAEAGGTVKLLCNVTATGPHNIAALPSGTYTLDLAGHKLSVGTDAENPGCFSSYENTALTITSSDGAGILNAELYIHGDFKVAANLSVEGLVNIYKSLEVDSTSYAAPTFNGEVTVKNGGTLTVRHGNFRKNVTVEDGGKLNAFERDGGDARFAYPVKINAGGKLRVTGSSSFEKLEIAAGADVVLEGGNFANRIYTSDGSPLAQYLGEDYAFADSVTDAIQNANVSSLGNVTVVGHTAHTSVDADTGKCACGKQMLAVRIARDNRVVAGYDNLPDALNEAAFGDTVRIFGDAATGNLVLHPQGMQPQITLDLNGKQVDGGLTLENVKLTVENGTLSATSALTVAKDASLTLNDVECGWDVTVSGKLAVTDADTVCTGTVTVKDGGSAALAGGAYKKIVCETGTVADCLEDAFGYTETANAESWLGGDGKTIADTTVLRIPLLLVTVGNTSVPYGTDATRTVLYDTIDISPDRSKLSFRWYKVEGGTCTPLAGETDELYVLPAGTLPGLYKVTCDVTYKGYTMRSDEGLIEIRKASLTEGTHYTAPTAAPVVYDGGAHALLNAGSIAANTDLDGCKFVYSTSEDGNYTETMPTAKAAGDYTVWYRVAGNNCFADSKKYNIDVHIAVATVTAANKDYPTSFTYGTTIPAPTKANLTITGDYDDATLTYAWRDAAGNTLAETPAELGSYTLHIEIAATANTGAAVVDIPVSIKPDTVTKAVIKSVSTYNGSSPRSYEVDLLALVKDAGLIPAGDTLTVRDQFDIFLFTDDGSYSAYDPATADYAVTAVKKDGEPTTLVITVSGLDRTPTKIYCMINVRLSNAHYTNIVAQISLVAKDKEDKTLSVMMNGPTGCMTRMPTSPPTSCPAMCSRRPSPTMQRTAAH